MQQEEKPKSFKLQKTVSTRQHGWTALISLALGIIFYSSVIGAILLVLGVVSAIIWLIRTIRERKNKIKTATHLTTAQVKNTNEKSDTLIFIKQNYKIITLLVVAVIFAVIGLLIYRAIQENNDRQDDMRWELQYQNCIQRQHNGEMIRCRNYNSLIP